MTTGRGRVPGKTRWYLLFLQPGHLRVHHLKREDPGPRTGLLLLGRPPHTRLLLVATMQLPLRQKLPDMWLQGSPPGDVEP